VLHAFFLGIDSVDLLPCSNQLFYAHLTLA
jgi:hypothetical protein